MRRGFKIRASVVRQQVAIGIYLFEGHVVPDDVKLRTLQSQLTAICAGLAACPTATLASRAEISISSRAQHRVALVS